MQKHKEEKKKTHKGLQKSCCDEEGLYSCFYNNVTNFNRLNFFLKKIISSKVVIT